MSITQKIAVITGANRGLGRAYALHLAEAGVDVVVTYRSNQAEAEEVVSAVTDLGRSAVALRLDTSVVNSFADFAEQLGAEAGPLGQHDIRLPRQQRRHRPDRPVRRYHREGLRRPGERAPQGRLLPDPGTAAGAGRRRRHRERLQRSDPFRRPGTGAVTALLSDANRWVTAQRIEISGGQSL